MIVDYKNLLERLSGAPAREVSERVIIWVWVSVGGDNGRLVAERAGARARAHARRHVQQAVKEGRLLHHAPRHALTHTRCACSCHTQPFGLDC